MFTHLAFLYILYICKPSLCNLKERKHLVVLLCVCVVYINISTEPAAAVATTYSAALCGVPFVASAC